MPGGFKQRDLLADVLEAGQHAAHLDAVGLADHLGELGGDDRRHRDGVPGHRAVFGAAAADVVEEQRAHMVSGEQGVVLPLLHRDADPVAVGVGGEHEVRARFARELEPLGERLFDLRVREGAGREVAVGVLLLGHDGHVPRADRGEHAAHRLVARAVEGGIDELEARFFADARIDLLGKDVVDKAVGDLLGDIGDDPGGERVLELHRLRAGEHVEAVDLFEDGVGGVLGHLAAVAAVDLIAVIFGGVVGGGDHDARVAAKLAGREGERRDGHQLPVDRHPDAVGGQHPRRFP